MNENQRNAHERYLSSLSNVLSGGLLTDTDKTSSLTPERALCRSAGCLLKAVMVANHYRSEEGPSDMRTWGPGYIGAQMSEAETLDALACITALLLDGDHALDHLRGTGDYRDSHQRIESLDDSRERAVRLAGEIAIEAEESKANGKAALTVVDGGGE
jgi:hypothetical protein